MRTMSQQQNTLINRQPWIMLGWLLATQILIAFVGRSIAPLGVLIGEDLSLTKSQIGLLPAALFLGQSLAALPSGFLVDRIGTKRMLLIVSCLLGGGYILMSSTSIFIVVLLMTTIGGMGYGSSHPASNRGILYWFAANKRGFAMGIKQMGVTLGSALAALLLLPIATVWGWRPAVIGASILLITVGALSSKFYKNSTDAEGSTKTDKPNLSKKPNQFFSDLMMMAKHKALVLVSGGAMILQGSQMILNTYLVLFAYEKLGFTLVLAGVLLVISEAGGSLGRICWGIVSDRFFKSERIIILIIIAVLTAGVSVLVAVLPYGTTFWMMVPITLAFGFCISGFNAIWMNAATEIVPSEKAGIATGFTLTVGSWGVLIGPPIFGLIVDVTGTYTMGWLFMASMMVVVMVLLLGAKAVVKQVE